MLDDRAPRGLRQGADAAGARIVEPLPEPTRRLPAEARTYWRLSGLGTALGLFVFAFFAHMVIAEAGAPDGWLWVPFVLAVAAGVFLVGPLPGLRWQRWAYEIRDDEIDLRHGALVVRRTLVPIRRVQHVDTQAGPLQGSLGLAAVTFHTAAGTTAIPALRTGEAEEVRARVATLARTRDDT